MFSLESPHRGDSNEYTQYTISQYKNENHPKLCQISNYGICSKGLKNEFETAVVNEPSVFEPLKFYCSFVTVIYLFVYLLTNFLNCQLLHEGVFSSSFHGREIMKNKRQKRKP